MPTLQGHAVTPGAQFCVCGQDAVTCQSCGGTRCAELTIWREHATASVPRGNIGNCCWQRLGLSAPARD